MATPHFIRRYPVAAYFVLTFAISWGGFIAAVGPAGLLAGTEAEFEVKIPLVAFAMLAGPSVAGLLLTGLVSGKAGLRELFAGLAKWRVGWRWYAFALLIAPLVTAAPLLPLGLSAQVFTAADKLAVILPGLFAGLTVVLEEIGWTGFATPRLRTRYGVLATGIIVGIPWGLWHLLQIIWVSGAYAASVPLAVFAPLSVLSGIAGLTAYRVLLVWLHDRTGSLLIVTLMHASLTACNVFIFRPEASGRSFLAYGGSLFAVECLVVVAMAAANGWRLTRQPSPQLAK